jgi:hypothetical protein
MNDLLAEKVQTRPGPRRFVHQNSRRCDPRALGRQCANWAFVVVRDPEQRRRFGVIYNKAAGIVGSIYAARGRPAHMSEEQYRRFMSAGAYPWDHIVEALPQNRRRAVLSRGAEGAASGRYEILCQRRKADRFRIYANSRQNSAPPNLVPFHSQPGLGGVGGST